MEPSCIFRLLLTTNWVLFLWDLYLDYRQYKVHLENEKRPKRVQDLITEEEYKKARDYKLDKHTYSLAHSVFSHVLATVVLCCGWMPWLWDRCEGYPFQAVVFSAANTVVMAAIDLPWDMYDTFIIEQKHGFNKQTVGFYLLDTLKKQAVGLAITAPIIIAIEWIVENGGPYFFVYMWVFVSVVILLLMTIYPAFIAPLFDKYIPLPEGELKTALANLLLFTASDVNFSNLPPAVFHSAFAKNVYEHLLIAAVRDLTRSAETFGSDEAGDDRTFSPVLLLVLAVTLHHLSSKSAQYLMNLCKEQFSLTGTSESSQLTSSADVTVMLKSSAQALLLSFTHQRGIELGETLIKGCAGVRQPSASPTGVRPAVRRVVEEVAECEHVLSQLLGGDQRSKEGRPRRAPDAPRDSLWCDRIDFHQQIHFNKASIMTSIVKVLLKSFTESIRMETYGKNAVEQIQVDCYYMQRGLSPLVADEVVVNSMVNQSLSSALKRCLDPVLIHPSKLSQLCEDKETTD